MNFVLVISLRMLLSFGVATLVVSGSSDTVVRYIVFLLIMMAWSLLEIELKLKNEGG